MLTLVHQQELGVIEGRNEGYLIIILRLVELSLAPEKSPLLGGQFQFLSQDVCQICDPGI